MFNYYAILLKYLLWSSNILYGVYLPSPMPDVPSPISVIRADLHPKGFNLLLAHFYVGDNGRHCRLPLI